MMRARQKFDLTQYMLDRHGVFMSIEETAKVLKIEKRTLEGWIHGERCPFPTHKYQDGRSSKRRIKTTELAEYIEGL